MWIKINVCRCDVEKNACIHGGKGCAYKGRRGWQRQRQEEESNDDDELMSLPWRRAADGRGRRGECVCMCM